MTEDAEIAGNPAVVAKLSARAAQANDLEAFLELARLYATERGCPFVEEDARWVFGGIPRADPAINVLLDDLEVVGFTLIRVSCLPLTRTGSVQQEVVFVREDKRSKHAEMLLHLTTIEAFKGMSPNTEIGLLVGASPHAAEIIGELRSIGFCDAAIRMTASRAQDQAEPASTSSNEGAGCSPTRH